MVKSAFILNRHLHVWRSFYVWYVFVNHLGAVEGVYWLVSGLHFGCLVVSIPFWEVSGGRHDRSGCGLILCFQTIVGGISVRCKTCLQVPDSRVQAWSQQSCLRRDKIQYFGKVLQNSLLTSHKMRLNRAILTMTLPCQ